MEATDASRMVCVVVVSYQEYSLTLTHTVVDDCTTYVGKSGLAAPPEGYFRVRGKNAGRARPDPLQYTTYPGAQTTLHPHYQSRPSSLSAMLCSPPRTPFEATSTPGLRGSRQRAPNRTRASHTGRHTPCHTARHTARHRKSRTPRRTPTPGPPHLSAPPRSAAAAAAASRCRACPRRQIPVARSPRYWRSAAAALAFPARPHERVVIGHPHYSEISCVLTVIGVCVLKSARPSATFLQSSGVDTLIETE